MTLALKTTARNKGLWMLAQQQRRILVHSTTAKNVRSKLAPLIWCQDHVVNTTPAKIDIPVVRCLSTMTSENTTATASQQQQQQQPTTTKKPTLKHVRAFPFVGSIIPALSGVPDPFQPYAFWPTLRNQYGDFYTIGLPSLGTGLYCCVHVVTDPREMVPVIKAGGSYPSGLVEQLWVSKQWNKLRQFQTKGLFENGAEWKRVRNFMQTDLLHPESARGYVPGMIQAAQLASQGAPASAQDLNAFLGRSAFDMFSTIMFGELTQVADPTTPTDPENERFVTNAAAGLSTSIQMLFHPTEAFLNNVLGITTSKCRFCMEAFDVTWEIAQRKIDNFMQRKATNQLSEHEQNSYLFRALDRQLDPESQVSVQEVKELAFSGLFAAVDTTSSVLGWNVFHIARSPEVQDKLYQELSASVAKYGQNGQLTLEALNRNHVPYLHAIIRETQRLTPAAPLYISKRLDADGVVINDTVLQKGDVVSLEGFSIGMDPAFVEDPEEFRPERWLPEAVAARKGTPQEVMDHPFLKEPFSQGARKCPGSRVAINEIQVMVSQLVLDWNMTSPIKDMKDCTYHQGTTVEVILPELGFESRT